MVRGDRRGRLRGGRCDDERCNNVWDARDEGKMKPHLKIRKGKKGVCACGCVCVGGGGCKESVDVCGGREEGLPVLRWICARLACADSRRR